MSRTSGNVQKIQDGINDGWPFMKRLKHLAELEASEISDVADHATNVATTAAQIATELGLGSDETDQLYFAARWHDIGKLAVPKEVLFKAGRLTPDEFSEIKMHTTAGVDLLGADAPKLLVDVTSFHHERYDGFGYHGLKGEDIPFEARIVAVADVHDALVSKREYKDPMPEADALLLMTGDTPSPGFGRRGFDPIVLRRFVTMRLADPEFIASKEARETLAAYAASEPMSDLQNGKQAPEGWLLKKSGHRAKYAPDDGGAKKLEVMLEPSGRVSYRRPDNRNDLDDTRALGVGGM